jgi:hypothetical protein
MFVQKNYLDQSNKKVIWIYSKKCDEPKGGEEMEIC